AELSTRVRAAIREADLHQDRFSLAQLRSGAPSSIWLMDDQPDAAIEESAQAARDWTPSSYQLPSYYQWVGIVQARLYAGDGALAYRAVLDGWAPLVASLLLHMPFRAIDAACLRGRAAVAAALVDPAHAEAARADASRSAAHMRKYGAPWARP